MFPCTKIAVLLQFPDLELKGAHMKFTGIKKHTQHKTKNNTPQLGPFGMMARCYMK